MSDSQLLNVDDSNDKMTVDHLIQEQTTVVAVAGSDSAEVPAGHIPKEREVETETKQAATASEATRTSPPESLFRKLAPSRTRYTILRDEL